MATAIEDLAAQLVAVHAASPLGLDDKLKAHGMARSALNRSNQDTDEWRRQRVHHGPVGTGKKSDALRESMKSKRGGK